MSWSTLRVWSPEKQRVIAISVSGTSERLAFVADGVEAVILKPVDDDA